MKLCYGYVRVSTVKQGEGVSLEAQKDAIEAFALRNNITISEWFEEKETAAKSGRPVFNRMVADLKRGKAAGLVIHKIDRSARNFADWAKIGDLADSGIDIHFATESLDFRSRGGRLTADIQAVIAADYVRNLRDETIKGLHGRLKQGLYPFKAPFGYMDNGGGKPKTIDPIRGPQARKLFELYATGNYSLRELQKEAKRIGIKHSEGRYLSKTNIEKVLRNPFYAGIIKILSTNQTYPGIHKPLIPMWLYQQVAAIRDNRNIKKVTKHQHRYRSLFRCALCSGAMIPELQKGHVYYRCQRKDCATKTVREDSIEGAVKILLRQYNLKPEHAAQLRNNFVHWIEASHDDNTKQHAELELAKVEERLRRLEDKLLDDVIDDNTYKCRKNELQYEKQRLSEMATQNVSKEAKITILDKFLELVTNLYSTYEFAIAAQKREIVKFATSNRLIEIKNVLLEPSYWLDALSKMQNLIYCGADSPSSRTHKDFEQLEDTLSRLEEENFEAILENIFPPNS